MIAALLRIASASTNEKALLLNHSVVWLLYEQSHQSPSQLGHPIISTSDENEMTFFVAVATIWTVRGKGKKDQRKPPAPPHTHPAHMIPVSGSLVVQMGTGRLSYSINILHCLTCAKCVGNTQVAPLVPLDFWHCWDTTRQDDFMIKRQFNAHFLQPDASTRRPACCYTLNVKNKNQDEQLEQERGHHMRWWCNTTKSYHQ